MGLEQEGALSQQQTRRGRRINTLPAQPYRLSHALNTNFWSTSIVRRVPSQEHIKSHVQRPGHVFGPPTSKSSAMRLPLSLSSHLPETLSDNTRRR
jgi:hypothetical protein